MQQNYHPIIMEMRVSSVIVQTQFKASDVENTLHELKNHHESKYGKPKEFRFEDNTKYTGTMVNNFRQGFGEYQFSNGDYYKGEWKQDTFHGLGIYKYAANKKIYYGNFLNGLHHYKGTLVNQQDNSIVYVGDWEEGLKSGKGLYWYSKNQYYNGGWLKGVKNGQGEHYKQGARYIGMWKNKRNGQGTFTTKEGIIYSGIWTNDVLENGKIQYPLKGGTDTYEGGIVKGMRNGNGVYIYYQGHFQDVQQQKQKAVYTGNYIKNKKQGPGKFKYANGDIFQGNFSEDKRHGTNCTYKWADGSSFVGTFEQDLMYQGTYIDNLDNIQRRVSQGQLQQ